MGNLSVDALAIAALIGFSSLLLIGAGLTAWLWKQSGKSEGDL
jgi:hypothetical protein